MLAQAKTSRPAVAEKPKHFLPPGGHCSSVVSSINIAAENKTPVVSRVIFRDRLQASGAKRPHTFPPQPKQTSPSSRFVNGGSTTRQAVNALHMPLVLPGLPVNAWKAELPANKEHKAESEPLKDVLSQTKIKKKGLLLPYKSSKVPKVSAENGDESSYADLTTRPASAPGDLSSLEGRNTENGVSLQGECSPSSPGIPRTPPPADTSGDSENRFISTLERAKKKFSRRQFLISTKTKSLHSPDHASSDKPPPSSPKDIESVEHDVPIPSPLCLPHLACISARPFFKANDSSRSKLSLIFPQTLLFLATSESDIFGVCSLKCLLLLCLLCSQWLESALDKKFCKDKVELNSVKTAETFQPSGPPKKPLPDLGLKGQVPLKPPRPPIVDLSCCPLTTAPGMLTCFQFLYCFLFPLPSLALFHFWFTPFVTTDRLKTFF